MCDCISYNQPHLCSPTGRREVVLPTPEHLKGLYENGKPQGICIDACIVEAIKMLWEHKVETLGCCCGHNQENPGVVIASAEKPERVKELLRLHDSREWDVMQWQLIKC